jgi:hypothetical protein
MRKTPFSRPEVSKSAPLIAIVSPPKKEIIKKYPYSTNRHKIIVDKKYPLKPDFAGLYIPKQDTRVSCPLSKTDPRALNVMKVGLEIGLCYPKMHLHTTTVLNRTKGTQCIAW